MPTDAQWKDIEPLTMMLMSPDFNVEEAGRAITTYIDREPRNAIALMMVLVINMGQRLQMEMSPPEDGENVTVSLRHAMYDKETRERMIESSDLDTTMQLVEHYMNGNVEAVYDHLIGISNSARAFMNLLAAAINLYQKIMRIGEDNGPSRLKSVWISENGVQTMRDIGDTTLGTEDGF